MDKYEYRTKTEQMLEFMRQKSYKQAMDIADEIDWRKVKNTSMLCAVSEIYEYNGEYEKSREILFLAYERSGESRKIIYRLGILALKLNDMQEACDCYEEFVRIAPRDPNQYILRYKILKSQNASLEQQIEALEEFKKVEYVEKWAFELANLYHAAGMVTECLEECDDLILWFSEGKYVYKAMELKMLYKPLTPLQQEKYNLRNEVAEAESPIKKESETKEIPAVQNVPEGEEVSKAQEIPESEAEESLEAQETPKIEDVLEVQEILETEEIPEVQEISETEETEKNSELEDQTEDIVAEKEPKGTDSILPDDIRKLMEELESEVADIEAQKANPEMVQLADCDQMTKEFPAIGGEAEKPLIQKVADQLRAMDVISETKVVEEEEVDSDNDFLDDSQLEEAVSHTFETPIMDNIIEEAPGIKLGDTQSMAVVAKALKNNIEVDTPEVEEVEDEREKSPYDTGFIVQGRYDLEAQSEIGLKAGLTEEQKKLFSYFVPVHGMSEQLVEVLQADKKCKSRYGTSRTGNLLIIGRKGSGKTVLAVDVVKAIQKARKLKQGKVGIVTADSLNKKNVEEILSKLHGGAVIIEKASRLNRRTVEDLCEVMEGQTGEMLVVLEDERRPLERMLEQYPQFKKKFTSRLELPVFINDELVTFGQTYAKENGYKIDEMGILALYSRIDMMQREERVVTVSDVKEIVDDAIENSQKASLKKLVKKVFGKNKDNSERILLREEDFK